MATITRRSALTRLAGCAAVAAWPRRSRGAAPRRPNLLLVITDQQFADALSCRMGSQWLRTPAMDELAARGRLFTRAYAANPLCMPQRNAMFTGLYPHQTRVTRNESPPGGLDLRRCVSLGTHFARGGYQTAYSGKWHLCFDARDHAAHGFQQMLPLGKGPYDTRVADAAIGFLDSRPTQPWLLVTSFLNPHNVCEWARRLAGRQQTLNCGEIGEPPALDQLPPAPLNLDPPRDEPDGLTLLRRGYHAAAAFPVGDFTADDWRRHRWGWYRMIELVDAELARVLAALRRSGQEQDTVVIFTSDHGECAGAHRFNQKTVFYEESARVPFVMAWPDRIQPGTCDRLLNTGVDLLPTMLAAADQAAPAELPGRNALPLALGQPVADWPTHLVAQNDLAQAGLVDGLKPTMAGRMVVSARHKYCLYSRGQQRESLVDLRADPGETRDLARAPAQRATLLHHRALLAAFARQHDDRLSAALLADEVKPIPFQATADGR
ncbi:MAG: sulfatase-like hydrolase/transferase [Fimbriimonadaceae bacterium]|nr:sulfatase-like hydrolase/transferase [Fimbriimonadaceae bacterium]